MQKFIYNKKNKILICVHAMFDSYQSNAAIEISKNLSDYMLGRFVKHQFDIIIGDNEYELIKHVACLALLTSLFLVCCCST
jgi:hypothetical protein